MLKKERSRRYVALDCVKTFVKCFFETIIIFRYILEHSRELWKASDSRHLSIIMLYFTSTILTIGRASTLPKFYEGRKTLLIKNT